MRDITLRVVVWSGKVWFRVGGRLVYVWVIFKLVVLVGGTKREWVGGLGGLEMLQSVGLISGIREEEQGNEGCWSQWGGGGRG